MRIKKTKINDQYAIHSANKATASADNLRIIGTAYAASNFCTVL
jgi:hypothetical protein